MYVPFLIGEKTPVVMCTTSAKVTFAPAGQQMSTSCSLTKQAVHFEDYRTLPVPRRSMNGSVWVEVALPDVGVGVVVGGYGVEFAAGVVEIAESDRIVVEETLLPVQTS